jgi:ABC-type transport system involved in multi-copper enzyme maturation permease subunit
MNLREAAARAQTGLREQPWRLWGRQLAVLVRREARRSLFSRRRLWVYLLAFAPVLITAIHRVVDSSNPTGAAELHSETQVLAAIIQLYYLRLGLFFACMGIFTWLFRGEMVERTLHYPFLSPVRREVLVVGKFLAGAVVAIAIFEVVIYSRFGSRGWAYVFDGPGLGQLGSYLLIIALGALGYGAVFLALSLVYKNPIVPGALFLGWETLTPVLPGWLQMLSVTFYLKHLSPVTVPVSGLAALFTVVTEPVSAVWSVAGLLCFTAAVLVFSCYRIRRVEITYTTD